MACDLQTGGRSDSYIGIMSAPQDVPYGRAAPAGWYDDGSGGLRWWDGATWNGQSLPGRQEAGGRTADDVASPPRRRSQHLLWALSPVYTLGLVTFIPALHGAIVLRRFRLWLWAGALIAGDILSFFLTSSTDTDPDGSTTLGQDVGFGLAVLLATLATIHAFRIRDEVFAGSGDADRVAALPIGRDPTVVASLAAQQRRRECAALAGADPGLARDLRLGRPDLVRDFDDGGLVDVNHVPEAHLVSSLGLTPAQARSIIEVREAIGGFKSFAEISGFTEVTPSVLDSNQDRIILL